MGIRVAIVDFIDGQARLAKPFAVETRHVQTTLLDADCGGGTPLAEAIGLARTVVETQRDEPLIITVTDDRPSDIEAVMRELQASYAPVCSLTIATDCDPGMLVPDASALSPYYERQAAVYDVDAIDEDRYLVSVRNAHQLVIVERGEGVVEVVNGDAATTQGDPTLLRQQHNPQWLGEGRVLVADSHNDRIVELERAEGGEWEVVWEIYAAEGVNFNWPRDADRLDNGNTLITDSLNKRVVEVNRTGATVWSYGTPEVPYEAERLPEGESVGAISYADADSDEPTTIGQGRDIPVLSFLLIIFQTGLQTPFWFNEGHVAVTIVSLGSVLTGFGVIVRDRVALG